MGEWQDISTAPDKRSVLLFEPLRQWVTVGYAENGCWSDERDEDSPIFPTYWMPLPEPPGLVTGHQRRQSAKYPA